MSKKKAFSGNTMTLKDFHGGSIPSDLPLPSAPGVSADWSGYDRPNSWGGPMGRPDHRDHRVRPNSSPATRHLDDKSPFLSHAVRIGRNFDEDERKPLDGGSAPRRTVSDESFRIPPTKVELKPEPALAGRGLGSAIGPQVLSLHSGRVSEGAHVEVSAHNLRGNSVHNVRGSHSNAWAARKELMVVGANEPVQSAWSVGSAVSKLAQASALENVSSGRWQTNHFIHHNNVEVVEQLEAEKSVGVRGYDDNTYNRMDVVGKREYSDTMLARHVEKGLGIEDGIQDHRKEFINHNRAKAPSYSELKERNPSIPGDRVQLLRTDGKFGGSVLEPPMQTEAGERPKVKLLPRTKPLESSEPPIIDRKQGYQRLSDSGHGQVETSYDLHGNVNAAKPGLAGVESENQMVERRKLNLRPRSQPLQQSEGNSEKERIALFGGARPREVVLKERGIDDVALGSHDLGQDLVRIKHNVPKTESVPEHAIPTRHHERTDNLTLDQRIGKKSESKDQRLETERVDIQRWNWRNENRRNNRDTERRQQLQQERQPSPETWRKPVEQPKAASSHAIGVRYGKTASALELAQVFSSSFSDPKTADRYLGQRGLPGKTQMPFSRLTGPTPRAQINGY